MIAESIPGRDDSQCLQRWSKTLRPGIIKGRWSPEEDDALHRYVQQWGLNWGRVAQEIGGRTSKQCRQRWCFQLDPSLRHGPFSEEEDQQLLQLYQKLGSSWSKIAAAMVGRTADAVKVRFKSLKRQRGREERRQKLHQAAGSDLMGIVSRGQGYHYHCRHRAIGSDGSADFVMHSLGAKAVKELPNADSQNEMLQRKRDNSELWQRSGFSVGHKQSSEQHVGQNAKHRGNERDSTMPPMQDRGGKMLCRQKGMRQLDVLAPSFASKQKRKQENNLGVSFKTDSSGAHTEALHQDKVSQQGVDKAAANDSHSQQRCEDQDQDQGQEILRDSFNRALQTELRRIGVNHLLERFSSMEMETDPKTGKSDAMETKMGTEVDCCEQEQGREQVQVQQQQQVQQQSQQASGNSIRGSFSSLSEADPECDLEEGEIISDDEELSPQRRDCAGEFDDENTDDVADCRDSISSLLNQCEKDCEVMQRLMLVRSSSLESNASSTLLAESAAAASVALPSEKGSLYLPRATCTVYP